MSLSNKDEPQSTYGRLNVPANSIKLETDPVRQTPPVKQSPPTNQPTSVRETAAWASRVPAEDIKPKEKKKCWLLRPVAWAVFLLLVFLMNGIINSAFLLAAYIIDWLSTLPTIAVILLTLAFGSMTLGLLFYGTTYLPSLVMTLSEAIYPSKIGIRYYIVGTVQLFISIWTIISALTGSDSGNVFWDCMTSVYFAIVYIIMLASTKTIIDD